MKVISNTIFVALFILINLTSCTETDLDTLNENIENVGEDEDVKENPDDD